MQIHITAAIVLVTPEMAEQWLGNRWGEQRAVRGGHVNRLLHDMDAGNFKIGPDAILIIKGKLANGQHRLEALVRHGKPLRFLVMESNDEELYKIIDDGMKRTAGDALIGMKYSQRIPSVARLVLAYESQALKRYAQSSADHGRRSGSGFKSKFVYTKSELIDYCNANSGILSEVGDFVDPLYAKSALLRWSIAGALYCLASNRGEQGRVKEFLTQVFTGGAEGTAAIELRNRLIQIKGSKKHNTSSYVFAITIKAYRSYLQGTTPGILKWAADEEFPQLPPIKTK